MQRWQYNLDFVKFNEEYKTVEILSKNGMEGWELVAVVETEGGFNFYFKRPFE